MVVVEARSNVLESYSIDESAEAKLAEAFLDVCCMNTTYDGRIQHQPDHPKDSRTLQRRLREVAALEADSSRDKRGRESGTDSAEAARGGECALQPGQGKEQGVPSEP